jgi:hypothetical protein
MDNPADVDRIAPAREFVEKLQWATMAILRGSLSR